MEKKDQPSRQELLAQYQKLKKSLGKSHPATIELRNRVVLANLGLIKSAIKRMGIFGELSLDLFQQGVIALIKAVESFDQAFHLSFSTFAYQGIFREIRRYFPRQCLFMRASARIHDHPSQTKRRVLTTESLTSDPFSEENESNFDFSSSPPSPRENYEFSRLNIALIEEIEEFPLDLLSNQAVCFEDALLSELEFERLLDFLSDPRQIEVLRFLYKDGLSETEIARELFLTRQRISQIKLTALNILRERLKREPDYLSLFNAQLSQGVTDFKVSRGQIAPQ